MEELERILCGKEAGLQSCSHCPQNLQQPIKNRQHQILTQHGDHGMKLVRGSVLKAMEVERLLDGAGELEMGGGVCQWGPKRWGIVEVCAGPGKVDWRWSDHSQDGAAPEEHMIAGLGERQQHRSSREAAGSIVQHVHHGSGLQTISPGSSATIDHASRALSETMSQFLPISCNTSLDSW